jgi:hypothetical protein
MAFVWGRRRAGLPPIPDRNTTSRVPVRLVVIGGYGPGDEPNVVLERLLAKVEDALGARKFCGAGPCNGTLDPDLTLATIRQAQPGATLDEIHRRRGFLESPRPRRIGTRGGAAD